MSVKRRDLVQYLEENGFHLLREGAKSLHLHQRFDDHPDQATPTARPDHSKRDLQTGGTVAQVLSSVRAQDPSLLTERIGRISRRHLELLWKGLDVLFDR